MQPRCEPAQRRPSTRNRARNLGRKSQRFAGCALVLVCVAGHAKALRFIDLPTPQTPCGATEASDQAATGHGQASLLLAQTMYCLGCLHASQQPCWWRVQAAIFPSKIYAVKRTKPHHPTAAGQWRLRPWRWGAFEQTRGLQPQYARSETANAACCSGNQAMSQRSNGVCGFVLCRAFIVRPVR